MMIYNMNNEEKELSCNCSHRFLTTSFTDRDELIVPLEILAFLDMLTPIVLILSACLIDMLVSESAGRVSTFVSISNKGDAKNLF
jgi:hypothetical protein